jgi:hypothetical protein
MSISMYVFSLERLSSAGQRIALIKLVERRRLRLFAVTSFIRGVATVIPFLNQSLKFFLCQIVILGSFILEESVSLYPKLDFG